MKNNILKSIFISLILLVGTTHAWAWDIGGNGVVFYYANTESWAGINMYYWGWDGQDWNANQSFQRITNTNIYYYKFDHLWTGLSGLKFNQSANDWGKQSSGNITEDLKSSRYWKGDETSSSTALANLNGAAEVITKISTGSNYTEQANTACVATVSGYNLGTNATSVSTVSAKTGSASSASINAAYGSTITYTSNTPTGYTFKGFSTSNSTSLPSNVATSKSVTADKVGGTANTIYYAYYLVTQYTITYDLNGGGGTMTPTTYNIETATFSLPEPTRNGYKFDGWYDNSSFTGTAVTQVTKGTTGNKTFYAKWTATETQYTVAIESAGNGSVSPTSVQAGSTTKPTIEANPATGYEFDRWEKDGGATVANPTSATTTVSATAEGTVTAYFKAKKYTITLNANGGSGNTASVKATYNSSTLSSAITNPTKTGYTFAGWYSGSGGTGSLVINTSGVLQANVSSYTGANGIWTKDGDVILYAKWTENKSTITVTTANSAQGTLRFGSTTKEWGTTASVGVTTPQNITATANNGYKFVRWELTGGARSSSTLTNATITLKGDGNGTAGTATAVFEEDLNSSWHLVGSDNIFPDGWNVNDNSMMKKRSGSSSEKKVYMTITVSEIKTYEFKVVDDNGNNSDIWYGYSSGNNFLEWTETSTKDVYTTTHEYNNDNNLKFTPNAVGDYEFKVDYSGNNPKVTITYPEVGSVSSYRLVGDWGNGWDSTGIAFNAEGKVSLELEKRERPDYTFKVKASNGKHYTAADEHKRQFTRQHNIETISDDTDYPVDDPHNLQLQADAKGTYIFEFEPATKQLKVTHPEREDGAYLVGDFSDGIVGSDDDDPGHDWTEEHGIQFSTNADQTEGIVNVCDWRNQDKTWNFKVKINGIWYGLQETMNTSGRWILTDEYAYLSTKNCTIQTNGENGCYTFKYTTLPNGDIELMIIFPNDTRAVTFNMNDHGDNFVQNVQYNQTATAPHVADMDNHLFCGWYTDVNCTEGKEYDFDTPVTEDITLYAKWIPYDDCIFFKNNLNWENVYVYFYSSNRYWDDWYGTGSNMDSHFDKDDNGLDHKPHYRKFRGKMSKIGKTDIWYIDYIATAKKIDPNNWAEIKNCKDIAFTQHEQYDKDWFWKTSVVRRGDFNKELPLYVPHRSKSYDKNDCAYHNHGLWMKYNSIESGYDWRGATSEDQNNQSWQTGKDFTADNPGGYSFTTVVKFENSNLHYFKIHNANSDWFGNGGTMTQTNCTKWIFGTDKSSNAKITPTVSGDNFEYIFTLYLGNGEVEVSLEYPLSEGDLRLAYKDSQADSFHPGHHIKKLLSDGTRIDTVSFFVWDSEEPKIILQTCTGFSDGDPNWGDNVEYDVNEIANVNADAVYNFVLKQTKNETVYSKEVDADETHLYTGDYYIRTDAAAGGWASFRRASNKMTYSSYAESHSNFNHYFVEWIHAGSNVKFTIANDYSYCISDTLDGDNYIEKDGVSVGCLPANANVRFGWDSRNNKLTRAYISGSSNVYDRFLVVTGNDQLKDANKNALSAGTNGSPRYGLNEHEDIFKDMGNWIYQVDVTANNQTLINLTAKYNDKVQIFKGQNGDPNYPLLTSTSNKNYKIRLIYNFKSNHLMMAWLAEDTPGDLGADMMVIRENQEQATQIDFTGEQLTNVKKAYAVMRFTNDFVNGSDPIHARKHYWISFPFDVKISEVFGFSEYMDHWILQWYDGQKRADEGWWYESKTFWKYITNKNYTLEKGVGYVLTLDLSKMGASSNVFENTDVVNLYFPSTGDIQTISGQENTTTTAVQHTCNIKRENRDIYDSHWNMIGVPGFADISNYPTTETQDKPIINLDTEKGGGPSFYYEYLPATNSYRATNETANFQTMYGYMVQYFGDLSWTTTIGVQAPDPIAARRNSESELPEKISLSLEIAQGEEMADQTFVQLQQEGATTEFDMNLDLTKIINSGANIYTLAGEQRIQSAGNALPMGEAIVPVGVQIAAEGEYTFRMPDGTEGMVVELVDYENNTRTNLLLSDYTVTLPKGSCETRFALHIQPQKDVVTGVENIGDGMNNGEGVKKYLIDGKLIIRTADGVLYDAQGHVVR